MYVEINPEQDDIHMAYTCHIDYGPQRRSVKTGFTQIHHIRRPVVPACRPFTRLHGKVNSCGRFGLISELVRKSPREARELLSVSGKARESQYPGV